MTHAERDHRDQDRKRKHREPSANYPPQSHYYPSATHAPVPPSPASSTYAHRGGPRNPHKSYAEYTYPDPAAGAAPHHARQTRHQQRMSSRTYQPSAQYVSENDHHENHGRPGKRHRTRKDYTLEDQPSDGELSDTGADVGDVSFDDAGDALSRKFATLNAALADILALITDKPEKSYPLLDRVLGRERSSFVKTMKAMELEGTLPWLVHVRRPPSPVLSGSKEQEKEAEVTETTCGLTLKRVTRSASDPVTEKANGRKVSATASIRSASTNSTVPPVPFSQPSIDNSVKRAKIWPPELPVIHNEDTKRQVFSHKSVVDGASSLIGSESLHNERLEFLGDSYLGAIVTRHIFARFPNLREGAMTSIRSSIVGNKNLHDYGKMYKFDKKLIAGDNKHAELLSRPKTVADMFEAYIGGLLLDRGSDVVDEWLKDLIEPMMKQINEEYNKEKPLNKAAKNEISGLIGGKTANIEYRWTDGLGGNQGGYCFTIFFTGWGLFEKRLGSGWGPNKTDASIRAAMNVLEERHALREVKKAKELWYEEQASASETGTVIRHDIP